MDKASYAKGSFREMRSIWNALKAAGGKALPLGFYSSKSKRTLIEQGLIEKVEGGYKLVETK